MGGLMATFAQIREALVETIEAGIETEIFIYDKVPDNPHCPALIVKPLSADYTVTFSLDAKYEFQLFMIVSRKDSQSGQEQLDDFVSHFGPNSVRQAVWDKPDLGLQNVDALVYGMTSYGGEFQAAKIPHVGAIFKVSVQCDNSVEEVEDS
jgi:hypothetical protein